MDVYSEDNGIPYLGDAEIKEILSTKAHSEAINYLRHHLGDTRLRRGALGSEGEEKVQFKVGPRKRRLADSETVKRGRSFTYSPLEVLISKEKEMAITGLIEIAIEFLRDSKLKQDLCLKLFADGVKRKEIAKQLGISLDTVYAQIYNARWRLRIKFAEQLRSLDYKY